MALKATHTTNLRSSAWITGALIALAGLSLAACPSDSGAQTSDSAGDTTALDTATADTISDADSAAPDEGVGDTAVASDSDAGPTDTIAAEVSTSDDAADASDGLADASDGLASEVSTTDDASDGEAADGDTPDGDTGVPLYDRYAFVRTPRDAPAPAGQWPPIALGDFDEDGLLDLAQGDASGIVVDLNVGDRSFTQVYTSATIPPGRTDAPAIVAADIDGDGHLDVALTSAAPGPFGPPLIWSGLLFHGSGDGNLVASGEFPQSPSATAIAVADVDGDGNLDLITCLSDLRIAYASTPGVFDQPPSVLPYPCETLAAGDFDGDGRADIVVGRTSGGFYGGTLLFHSDAKSFQSLRLCAPTPDGCAYLDGTTVVVGDVNHDGLSDFVVGSSVFFTARGVGFVMSETGTLPSNASIPGGGIALDDFDHDGHVDFVGVLVAFGDGAGGAAADRPPIVTCTSGVAAADLDADGVDDFVEASAIAWGEHDLVQPTPLPPPVGTCSAAADTCTPFDAESGRYADCTVGQCSENGCVATGSVPDGTACNWLGRGNHFTSCLAGECQFEWYQCEARCLVPSSPCHVGVLRTGQPITIDGSDYWIPGNCIDMQTYLGEGQSCGTNLYCQDGSCTCVPDQPCVLANACHIGVTSCVDGQPVCNDTGAADDWTSCGAAKSCYQGTCIDCVPDSGCRVANPCHVGRVSCDGGVRSCVDTGEVYPDGLGWCPAGTCQGGACVGCTAEGASCSANAQCCQGVCNGTICKSCKADGEACAQGSECCTGVCNPQHTCGATGCAGAGQSCGANGCCVGNNCRSGTCCAAAGSACSASAPCCDGYCNNGQCVACIPDGGTPIGGYESCCSHFILGDRCHASCYADDALVHNDGTCTATCCSGWCTCSSGSDYCHCGASCKPHGQQVPNDGTCGATCCSGTCTCSSGSPTCTCQ